MTFAHRTGRLDRDFAPIQEVEQSIGVIADLYFMRHGFSLRADWECYYKSGAETGKLREKIL